MYALYAILSLLDTSITNIFTDHIDTIPGFHQGPSKG
jgi:hypothetical protein